MIRETSKEAFGKITGSGAKTTLRDLVFAEIVDIGPVHNLRLLESLQQKEKLKKKADRIEWTRSNCWPRVSDMTGAGGAVYDLGVYRGLWYGKRKTLHFWGVSGQSKDIPPGWEKVERKPTAKPKTVNLGVPVGAKQKYFFKYEERSEQMKTDFNITIWNRLSSGDFKGGTTGWVVEFDKDLLFECGFGECEIGKTHVIRMFNKDKIIWELKSPVFGNKYNYKKLGFICEHEDAESVKITPFINSVASGKSTKLLTEDLSDINILIESEDSNGLGSYIFVDYVRMIQPRNEAKLKPQDFRPGKVDDSKKIAFDTFAEVLKN